jgi:hypothetical protein
VFVLKKDFQLHTFFSKKWKTKCKRDCAMNYKGYWPLVGQCKMRTNFFINGIDGM